MAASFGLLDQTDIQSMRTSPDLRCEAHPEQVKKLSNEPKTQQAGRISTAKWAFYLLPDCPDSMPIILPSGILWTTVDTSNE
jgi:hypothetical protein